MKPNHTTPQRRTSGLLALGAGALLLLTAAAPVRAIPDLSVVGGSGVAGSTVAATIALSDDNFDNQAASADVDLVFPPDQLTFTPPVTENCTIDPRIASTHEIAGRLEGGNTLILSILVSDTPTVIPRLGNGPLASCNFRINPGVPAGTAALTIENPGLFNDNGDPIDVNTTNGSIQIVTQGPPTATVTPPRPTPTNTGGGGTSTPTRTGGGATATPTRTGGTGGTSTPTVTGGGGTSTPTNTGGGGGTSTPTRTGGGGTGTPTRTGGTGGTATPTVTGGGPTRTRGIATRTA